MIFLDISDNVKNQFFYCGSAKNKLYCNLFFDGSIVEMDATTGVMHQLNTTVMSEPDCWSNGGMDYLYVDDMVYIVENRRKKIACYDIKNNKCSFCELNGTYYTLSVPNYTLATIMGDNIYIFPRFDKQVILFNFRKKCVSGTFELPLKNVSIPSSEMLAQDPVSAAIFSTAKRLGDNVFLTCDALKKIVVFNLVDGGILYKDYPDGLAQCIDFIIKDDKLYLVSVYGDVYFFDINIGEYHCISVKGDKFEFGRILVTDVSICWLPCLGNDILLYDIASKDFLSYDDYPEDFVYALRYPEMAKFFARCEDDDWYYMAMCAQNYMLKVSKRTGQLYWIKPIGISNAEKLQFYRQKGVSVINESSEFDLCDFLKYKKGAHEGCVEACGRIIYDIFRGALI